MHLPKLEFGLVRQSHASNELRGLRGALEDVQASAERHEP
jgi:hypothetical protein